MTSSKGLCGKNNDSLEHLKECIKENNVIVENIYDDEIFYGLKSAMDKFYLLDAYTLYNFVQPKDGSIKFSPHNSFQLGLDPTFEYQVAFYDTNFMIMTINPDIVKRNGLLIKKSVYPFIYLRVNKYERTVLTKTSIESLFSFRQLNIIN